MTSEITFPGGLKVKVLHNGHEVVADQPVAAGGEDSAPSPFDLFIVSIGACAGFYALKFCRARKIPTEGMSLTMDSEYGPEDKMIRRIDITIRLPQGFPGEYRQAMVKVVESCTVKKHLEKPPKIGVKVAG